MECISQNQYKHNKVIATAGTTVHYSIFFKNPSTTFFNIQVSIVGPREIRILCIGMIFVQPGASLHTGFVRYIQSTSQTRNGSASRSCSKRKEASQVRRVFSRRLSVRPTCFPPAANATRQRVCSAYLVASGQHFC